MSSAVVKLRPSKVLLPAKLQARRTLVVQMSAVRPYTVRKGDMVSMIAQKRGLSVEQIKVLNPRVDLNYIYEGQTLLLPAKTYSSRDMEIMRGIAEGIGKGGTRTYPVREGETIEDIIGKRNVKLNEVSYLNPGVNLESLSPGQKIYLPSNCFSEREREVLAGIIPDYITKKETGPNLAVYATVALALVGLVFLASRFFNSQDD